MRVTVTCFGALRDYLPPGSTGNRASVEVPDDATVGDLLGRLGAPPQLVFAMLVDEQKADAHCPLKEGATVTLMPPFTGGARATSAALEEEL